MKKMIILVVVVLTFGLIGCDGGGDDGNGNGSGNSITLKVINDKSICVCNIDIVTFTFNGEEKEFTESDLPYSKIISFDSDSFSATLIPGKITVTDNYNDTKTYDPFKFYGGWTNPKLYNGETIILSLHYEWVESKWVYGLEVIIIDKNGNERN